MNEKFCFNQTISYDDGSVEEHTSTFETEFLQDVLEKFNIFLQSCGYTYVDKVVAYSEDGSELKKPGKEALGKDLLYIDIDEMFNGYDKRPEFNGHYADDEYSAQTATNVDVATD